MVGSVIVAKIRFPFFSIRHVDVYQVQYTYRVILPTTIQGAIGYGLSLLGRCFGYDCNNKARSVIRKAREFAQTDASSTYFPVILRRWRGILENKRLPRSFKKEILCYKEQSSRGKKKKENESKKSEDECFFDALVREYVFAVERSIVVVPSDLSNEGVDVDDLVHSLKLIDRLGDSESLASVVEASVVDVEECSGEDVNVMVKFNLVKGAGKNLYVEAYDEKGNRSSFLAPYSLNKGKVTPSSLSVKSKVMCNEKVNLRIPAGDDW